MKRLISWLWHKALNFIKWVWRECKNWQTLLLLGVVCAVVGAPVWICGLLWIIFGWQWALWVASGLLAFWWLPGMPYFAVCISITLIIKRFFQKYKRKKRTKAKQAAESADEATIVNIEQHEIPQANNTEKNE